MANNNNTTSTGLINPDLDEVNSLIFDYGSSKFSFGFNGDELPLYRISPVHLF